MVQRTRYQEKIIQRYYENFDSIQLQRLSEQVSELYLAEGKARQRQWKKVAETLAKMKIPADRIDHLVASDNPALLANLVQELMGK